MKMETQLSAAVAGIVREVRVQTGATVEAGGVVAVIEPN
jgi:biotin carboxyl carrier protein